MITRKQFLKTSVLGAAGLSLYGCETKSSDKNKAMLLSEISALKDKADERDENFWHQVRQLFPLAEDVINLNNGGVSVHSRYVEEAYLKADRYSNSAPSLYMWRDIAEQREVLRKRMADFLSCDKEELAFNRNTTEGLNTIIFGLPLKAGDEVVLTKYDYPHMTNAWKQRAERDGLVLKWVDMNLPEEDDEAIFQKFKEQINTKTRIIHLTHVINWTGQILPVKKIADYAKQAGCEVIADTAHSFAQIPFAVSDLNCDYMAAPGHKWLTGYYGTGILYVKRQHISKIYPLLSAFESQRDDIRKFETLGTRPFASEAGLLAALDLHESIGITLIQKRLRYLKDYWLKQALTIENITSHTSAKIEKSNALATISIKNTDGKALEQTLLEKYKIHTTEIIHEKINGIRISPHIYTTTAELDMLLRALKDIAL